MQYVLNDTEIKNEGDMLVSVIVTCYNSEAYIEKAIESVLSQTYKNIECIVVDDGSTDNSSAVIHSLAEKDDRVRFYKKENGGAGSARNYGIKKSKGEWFQVLDGDDWLHSKKIENQIKAAKKQKDKQKYTLLYSDWEVVFEDDFPGSNKKKVFEFEQLSKDEILKIIIGRKFGFSTPIPVNVINTLLSKNIFDEVQYNEEMPNVEDLDYFYKVLQLDCALIYVPGVCMSYRQHNEGISKQGRRALQGYTMYIENILNDEKEWLQYFPNLLIMMEKSILYKMDDVYKKLIYILKNSKIPVFVNIFGKDINLRELSIHLLKRGYFLKFVKLNIVSKRKIKKLR